MKTTKITVSLTPDEIFTIAYAMEEYIRSNVAKDAKLHAEKRHLDWLFEEETYEDEFSILNECVGQHSYKLRLSDSPFPEGEQMYAEQWFKALVAKAKEDALHTKGDTVSELQSTNQGSEVQS